MKIKIERTKKNKIKKAPTLKVGTHKKSNIALWILLVSSLAFGIYKNFTAIDQHTTHEKEVIEQKVVDTSRIKTFSENFISSFYSWENNKDSIEKRNNNLKNYLTEGLQALNLDMIRQDIPTISRINYIKFWDIKQIDNQNFDVTFSVNQKIIEQEKEKNVESTFTMTVHVDEENNLVVVKNPTVATKPTKSSYEPKAGETDQNIDEVTIEEINSFLDTFFKLYPKTNEKELTYYVSNNALKPINKDYVFSELINPIYTKKDNDIIVNVAVKYLDQQSKAIQISQFNLTLQKNTNWIITDNK